MSFRLILTLFCVYFYVLLVPVLAQEPVQLGRKSPSLKQLTLEYWNTDDGLVSNNLNDVIQSKDGFIWATTFNGIIRYDGMHFDEYDKSNIDSMDFNAFYEIFEDSKNGLWITTQTNGVLRYNNGRFSMYEHNDTLPSSIRAVIEDAKGHIWIGTMTNGLFHDNGDSIRNVQVGDRDGKHLEVMELSNGLDGSVWVGTDGDGVYHYADGRFEHYDLSKFKGNNVILNIEQISDSIVLVGTYDGLNKINTITKEITQIGALMGNGVNEIHLDNRGNIWYSCKNGLARSNTALENFEFLKEEDGLPAREITSVCFDYEQNIWAATRKGGLIKLKESNFYNITVKNGLSLTRSSFVKNYGDKGFLIGSDNGDVDYLNINGVVQSLNISGLIAGETLRDIHVEEDEIWVATYAGLLKVDKEGNEKLIKDPSEIPSKLLRTILKTRNGDFVIATRDAGLLFYDGKDAFVRFDENNGLGGKYILCTEQLEDGRLVVGTNGGGLNFIDEEKNVEIFQLHKDPSGVLFFNIQPYKQGLLLATNMGIWYFENGGFTKLLMEGDLGTDTFFDLIIDHNEHLWLSSTEGLFSIEVKEVSAFLDRKINSIKSIKYDDKDGMFSRECSPATKMLLTQNNDIWVPTLGGVSIINSYNLTTNSSIPPVYITAVNVDDNIRPYDNKKVVVDPGHFRFTINFTALSYYAPSKMKFKYMLEGVDEQWQMATSDDREASYTNIAPGTYKFKVIASNNDGVWNDKGAEATIVIRPYFYQNAWFRVGGSLLVVLLFTGIFQYRIYTANKRNKTLKKLNDELDSFVYSTSHDLRAPLASVLGLLNLAQTESSEEIKSEYLNMMEKSVKKLDGFIKDIIDYSRNSRLEIQRDTIQLEEMVVDTFEGFKFMDDEERIAKDIKIDLPNPFQSDTRRIKIILNNLISNSIRYHRPYSAEPVIGVIAFEEEEWVVIQVKDNGQGIDEKHMDKIFNMFYRATEGTSGSGLGLYIVKETALKLKGNVSVESKKGEGTTFTVKIPK